MPGTSILQAVIKQWSDASNKKILKIVITTTKKKWSEALKQHMIYYLTVISVEFTALSLIFTCKIVKHEVQ